MTAAESLDLDEAALVAARRAVLAATLTPDTEPAPGPARDPHPDGVTLAAAALTRARTLTRTIRDTGHAAVADTTDDLHRDHLVALVAVLAAMCPPDITLDTLAWVYEPPSAWPDTRVRRDAARARRGARDAVARLALAEYLRRHRLGPTAGAEAAS